MSAANMYAPKDAYPYPSVYGSHGSMVDADRTKSLNLENFVVCVDLSGPYVTDLKNLDTGMADPNRCASAEWRESNLTRLLAGEGAA